MTLRMWLHGLVAAFIGGGAGAVSAGFSAAVLAPDQFNFSAGVLPMLKLMVLTFVVSGIVAAMAYLKKSPVPEIWDGQDRRGETPPTP